MSGQNGNKKNFEPLTASENECWLFLTLEQQTIGESTGTAWRLAAALCGFYNRNFDTNAEEMNACYEEVRKGKCQKQIWSEIREFWDHIQTYIKRLSVSFLFIYNFS